MFYLCSNGDENPELDELHTSNSVYIPEYNIKQ
jgi:hypothetical protein